MSQGERLQALLRADKPILLAPMASAMGLDGAIAMARAGGLAALPCASIGADEIRRQVAAFRAAIRAPINLNFFCHAALAPDPAREARWRQRLTPYAEEFGVDLASAAPAPQRQPFDETLCALVEALRPEVVSFHFGLPAAALLRRVKRAGAAVIASATVAEEARWLEAQGADAVIAQGAEAGGHRGMFLATDVTGQVGAMALVPQIADAVKLPVIAAGGIADGRAVRAALALGAGAVQLGTAFLRAPEALSSPLQRRALENGRQTAITNLFTGRPARGIVNRLMRECGPMNSEAPPFPTAAAALAPLRTAAESLGRDDFTYTWAGQQFAVARAQPVQAIAARIAGEAGL